jgi:hypothetical protein
MSNNIKTLPALTVGATALQIANGYTNPGTSAAFTLDTYHKWASVSIQADPSNTGIVYVGDSKVSTTRYSRALNPGDWYTVAGSAVDPNKVWVVGSTTGQVVHPSGS